MVTPSARERHVLLSITVFLCGATVLILEILGARLLAPFFGSTQFVWSSLIAVTLLALSVGYGAGGRLADRTDPLAALYRALVVAGWLIVFIPLLRRAVLPAALTVGMRAGALLAAFALLAAPLGLLGCVAPLAAKTAVSALSSLGVRVGGLYALSTVGSLAGALATGFVLIPLLGVTRILLVSALLVFLPALWFWFRSPRSRERSWWRIAAGAGVLGCLAGIVFQARYPIEREGGEWTLIEKRDSPYGEVRVVQYLDRRILLLDGTLQTGLDLSRQLPLFSYAAAIQALVGAAHPGAARVLLIGFGGGVLAEQIARGGATVESVEIDPVVAEAARRFFLSRSDLPLALADGRVFLGQAPRGSYDVVILDAYAGEAPPSHLFTVEAYRLVRHALREDGIGIANVIGMPGTRFVRSVGRTIREVFPWVRAYANDGNAITNVLFVFGRHPREIARLPGVPTHPQALEDVRSLLTRRVALPEEDAIVLSDEYNPVETMNFAGRERMRRHLLELFPRWILLE